MNKTKQKAIIKKLYRECNYHSNFIGYHDYGDGLYGFFSPYRIYFTSETYDEPAAKEIFPWEECCSRKGKTYVKVDAFDMEAMKASAKVFKVGGNPFLLYGPKFKYGINPKYLKDAMEWCGKDFYVEVDMDNANSPIWCFGCDGTAIIAPMRLSQ